MEYLEEEELCHSEQWRNRQTEGGMQGEKRMSGRSQENLKGTDGAARDICACTKMSES